MHGPSGFIELQLIGEVFRPTCIKALKVRVDSLKHIHQSVGNQ